MRADKRCDEAVMPNVERIGNLFGTLGSERFGREFFGLMDEECEIDHFTAFGFSPHSTPCVLIAEGRSLGARATARELATEYVSGAFELDPNIRRNELTQPASVPIVHRTVASEVGDRNYRRRFYEEPCLAQELVLLGRVDDTLYYMSLYRAFGRSDFGQREIDRLHFLSAMILKALHRHGQLSFSQPGTLQSESRPKLLAHVRDVLLAEPCALSPREAEVCAAVVLGYTTLAISLNLQISMNTVATHRKRAYAKLRICSQNELFARYFDTIARFRSAPTAALA